MSLVEKQNETMTIARTCVQVDVVVQTSLSSHAKPCPNDLRIHKHKSTRRQSNRTKHERNENSKSQRNAYEFGSSVGRTRRALAVAILRPVAQRTGCYDNKTKQNDRSEQKQSDSKRNTIAFSLALYLSVSLTLSISVFPRHEPLRQTTVFGL